MKIAALLLLVAVAFSYDGVFTQAQIERVQDATAELRARGVSDEQIAQRLAQAAGVSVDLALEVVRRSYGRTSRDSRSLRTIEGFTVATVANEAAAAAAIGAAWCEPLTGLAEHAACVAAQASWFGGSLCNGSEVVRAKWAHLHLRPAEAKRIRDAAAASGVFEAQEIDRAGFEAAAAARGWHVCSPGTAP